MSRRRQPQPARTQEPGTNFFVEERAGALDAPLVVVESIRGYERELKEFTDRGAADTYVRWLNGEIE